VSHDGQTVRVDPQQVPPVEGRVFEILELRLTPPDDASV
jgi:hypothetical protein